MLKVTIRGPYGHIKELCSLKDESREDSESNVELIDSDDYELEQDDAKFQPGKSDKLVSYAQKKLKKSEFLK